MFDGSSTQKGAWLIACVDPVNSWKRMLIDYLKNPSAGASFKLKQKVLNYVPVGDELHKKSVNGGLLKCLDKGESYKVMGEVHEGICGSHKIRNGYFISMNITGQPQQFIAFSMSKDVRLASFMDPFKGWPADELHQY